KQEKKELKKSSKPKMLRWMKISGITGIIMSLIFLIYSLIALSDFKFPIKPPLSSLIILLISTILLIIYLKGFIQAGKLLNLKGLRYSAKITSIIILIGAILFSSLLIYNYITSNQIIQAKIGAIIVISLGSILMLSTLVFAISLIKLGKQIKISFISGISYIIFEMILIAIIVIRDKNPIALISLFAFLFLSLLSGSISLISASNKFKKEEYDFVSPLTIEETKKSTLKKPAQLPRKKMIKIGIIASIIISAIFFLIYRNLYSLIISFIGTFIIIQVYFIFKAKLKESERIKKMEDVFPDFIQLMSSNLRAGLTVDRALLLSSRKEFSPLDKEILQVGKDLLTGREMSIALKEMGERTKSEKIKKTIMLITSGIRSGGNLAIILEETASNMRERNFIEKKAASNVLMYAIFIFFAVSIGAPILFGLSAVLVEVLKSLLASVPKVEVATNLPFTLTEISISTNFITYFAIVFLIVTDILAALVLGLVNKGEEKEGLKYAPVIIVLSIVIFIIIKISLSGYFSGLLG
ncbi:MAG: type II secretion system F family protein, partial [Candidatus Pacearchaeota archaeon]|nr:type II secretion system F family protein [Candidatus Pacearchaeota archaeon]